MELTVQEREIILNSLNCSIRYCKEEMKVWKEKNSRNMIEFYSESMEEFQEVYGKIKEELENDGHHVKVLCL